jgi:hypothetical protein
MQVYLYFKEWGEELFTYKLLEELNDVGVFTIKYEYNDCKELLWVYELCPKDENSNEFCFEYGRYKRWIPDDDPKYGKRTDKFNKLNWYFTKAGKFAYAERIVEDELVKHGGLFIGPERTFYTVQINKRPVEFLWKNADDSENGDSEIDENELDLQEAQKMVMDAVQRCLQKNKKNINNAGFESEKQNNI